ncbi:rhomboid family intramembrane serine protease [Haloterrigena sp. SYSU A121-1]|uniref:Rhomboid family intramembrane serine protease n=1 Tax=Haloterrigena gelatinilytica TaxID=2741724 RepID=A0A8J8KG50_9EURY|nr:rhomboid family intramembrane serine protease [Haloterrigena gelatinilytica]NUB91692.1 rhomboid family intramembrane serine protease [Haloterrigena gelatinilytica]
MPVTPTQAVLVVTVLVALGFVWYTEGRGRWRSLAADRFVYGVPWGTVVTVAIVVTFYVLVQSDVRHVSDPVTLPFITWSYFYPMGLLTAGIAHGSPGHIAANMAGTLAFGPIVEYAWGHYPPSERPRAEDTATGETDGGVLARPSVRALVAFPITLLAAAFLTSVFALGPGLGFSGAVFAIAGVAVVTYPIATIVAAIAANAIQTLYLALSQPVVRETFGSGTPGPPTWAGIGFQAHLLGFLIGVLCGASLLRRRGRRPATERLFFATLALGLVQALWLLVWSGDDAFVLYRGAGVVLVVLLTLLITAAITGSARPLPRPLSVLPGVPTRRRLAIGWLALLAIALVAAIVATVTVGEAPLGPTIGLLLVGGFVLALPALPPVVPDRVYAGPVTRRGVAVATLVAVTVLIAAPSVPFNLLVVGDDTVPGDGGVEVGDYTVTYERNVTPGQQLLVGPDPEDVDEEAVPLENRQSGLIVVNADREIWAVVEHTAVIAHEGNATIEIGGFGWRETVRAERTGWDVVGNESAYAVDLTVDGETTRSFASDSVRASATIDGRAIELDPTDDAFLLRVTDDGDAIGEAEVPDVNETTSIGDVEFSTAVVESDDADDSDGTDTEAESVRLFASVDDTEVLVAERESYADSTA